MKAKLNKVDNGWVLLVDNVMCATDNDKLSLKNCQEIERSYDLDVLADEWVFETNGHKWSNNDNTAGDNYSSFKAGFQKALEILGDKKFSEEDVRNIFAKALENAPSTESHTRMISDVEYRHSVMNELYDRITESLQKTEWDVEIEMEFVGRGKHGIGSAVNHYMPKRDADGCLILKLKSE